MVFFVYFINSRAKSWLWMSQKVITIFDEPVKHIKHMHLNLQCLITLTNAIFSIAVWIEPLSGVFLKPRRSLIFPVPFNSRSVSSFYPPRRWAATRNLRPSPWASSSPPNLRRRRRRLLLPRSPSTVYPSPSHGTSSSASQTSRTSALRSAAFTSASSSSPSRSKVGGFVCGLVCLLMRTCSTPIITRVFTGK